MLSHGVAGATRPQFGAFQPAQDALLDVVEGDSPWKKVARLRAESLSNQRTKAAWFYTTNRVLRSRRSYAPWCELRSQGS